MTQSHILGIATQFPELQNTVEGTEAFFKKWAKPSEGQVHSSSLALCFYCSSLSDIPVRCTNNPTSCFNPRPHSLEKTLKINRSTRILTRPSVSALTSPLLNGPQAPTIKEVNKVFMQEGVKLAVQAAEKALADWGGKREDITHLGEWERVCESDVCGSRVSS